MQIRMRGGSIETEVNELMVRPWGVPSGARTVATATPVANKAQAFRKAAASNRGPGSGSGLETGLDKAITLILS